MANRFRPPAAALAQIRQKTNVPARPVRNDLKRWFALGRRLRGDPSPIEKKNTQEVIIVNQKMPEFNQLQKQLYDVISEDEHRTFCIELHHGSILGFIQDAQVLVIATNGTLARLSLSSLLGFATISFETRGREAVDVWKIDVICSSTAGKGKMMIKELETFARDLGVKAITLDAVRQALGFWRHVSYMNTRWPKCHEHPRITKLWQKLVKKFGKKPLDSTAIRRTTDFPISSRTLVSSIATMMMTSMVCLYIQCLNVCKIRKSISAGYGWMDLVDCIGAPRVGHGIGCCDGCRCVS